MSKVKKRGKSHPVVGLDIGAGSVKLCYVIEKSGQFHLSAIDGVEIAAGGSSSERRVSVVKAIRTLVDRNKIKTKRAALAVSGQVVAIRRIEMPKIADDRLAQIVRYDAEQQIPFPLKEVIWDFFKQEDKAGEMVHVLLVAARKDAVEELASMVMEAGLEPEVITVNSLAAYSACRPAQPQGDAVAYVDVGANSTDVTIEWQGDLCFSRSIHYAGNRLTEDMQKSLGVDTDQAEKIKRRLLSGEGTDEEKASLLSGLRRIGMEIQRTLNFFRTESGGVAVEKMFLSGGVSMHKEFMELLQEGLGIPVAAADPFVNIRMSEKTRARIPFPSVLSTVVGLGLAGVGHRRTQENLLPDIVKAKKQIRYRMAYVAACVVVAGFIFMGLGALKKTSIRALESDVQHVQDEIERLTTAAQEIRTLNDNIEGLNAKMGRMAALNVERGKISDMLVEVARLLGADTRIIRMLPSETEPGLIMMDLYTPSTSSFESLVERMKQSPLMTDVRREGEPVKVVLRYEGDGTGPKAAPPSGGGSADGSVRDDLLKEARKRGVDVPDRARRKEAAAPKQDAGTRQVPAEVKAVWKFTVAFKMK